VQSLLAAQAREHSPHRQALPLLHSESDVHESQCVSPPTSSFAGDLQPQSASTAKKSSAARGNFKSGYCVLKDQNIIIVNKFYTTEGKINALLDILRNVALDTSKFSEKSQKLYEEIAQLEIKA
jgi:hypothetical protein